MFGLMLLLDMSQLLNATPDWEKWRKNPQDVELYQFMGKDNVIKKVSRRVEQYVEMCGVLLILPPITLIYLLFFCFVVLCEV